MLNTLSQLLAHQYEASLSTLNLCVAHCPERRRHKAREAVARESADALARPSGFHWRECSRAELHVYNIRHIQHHAAQLSLRLRLDANIDIPWVSHAWKEV